MNSQSANNVRKTNPSVVKSLVTGLLSLLVYAIGLPLIFNVQSDAWIVIALIVGIGGITLCVISLNASSEALKQFRRGDNVETGYAIAIIGSVLGILDVIASIF